MYVDGRHWNPGRPKGSKSKSGTIPPGKRASYMITFPNGYIEMTNNLRSFCKKYEISRAGMNRVLSGMYDKWKGYDIIHFG